MVLREIESQEELRGELETNSILSHIAFQNLDLTHPDIPLSQQHTFVNCLFLGCKMPVGLSQTQLTNSLVFPELDVPFNTFINKLYTRESLMGEYRIGDPDSYEQTLDMVVYKHYLANGKEANNIYETLARRLHDHSITDALHDFLDDYEEKRIVAIMGGHGLLRTDDNYRVVVMIAKALTESGYLMVSGGGPGAMEATHVGAWVAGHDESTVDEVLDLLKQAPSYKDRLWLDKAFEVLSRYPTSSYKSLGIPTWLYGHEPPTPFASHIAKYFANSVREDGLLAIAKGGVIFSPGSAGTIQEIFQDATQNHYLNFGYASPMVFLNSDYWTKERPVYPLLQQMANEGKYENMILSCCDTAEQVIGDIKKFLS